MKFNKSILNGRRGGYIFLALCLSVFLVCCISPFIGLADGFSRWNLAMEICKSGKISSNTLLSPILPYFKAITYKMTGGFILFTILQVFLFYISVGMYSFLLLKEKVVSVFKAKIPLWFISSFLAIFFPTCFIFPALLTDSSAIFSFIGIWIFVHTQLKKTVLRYICEFILLTLCAMIRINSLVLFVFLMLYFFLRKQKIHSLLILLSITTSLIFPRFLLLKTYNASTLGMIWELTRYLRQNKDDELFSELKSIGNIEVALERYNDDYLNNLIWDNSPPFPAYDTAGKNANKITKLYAKTFFSNPISFSRNKCHFIKRSLGIGKKTLISSARGIHGVDSVTKQFGALPSDKQQAIRNLFIKFTDSIGLISLRPYLLIFIAVALSYCAFVLFGESIYLKLSTVAVGYYSSFLINTQAHEFRYYAPTFFILLIISISALLRLSEFMIEKFSLTKKIIAISKKYKIIAIALAFTSISAFCAFKIYRITHPIIRISSLTDSNWTKGILNSNKQTLLFAYDAKLLEKIQESDILQAQNEKFFIVKVENDSKWIRVTVDKDASACAYPANIAFSNLEIEFDIDSLFENVEDE